MSFPSSPPIAAAGAPGRNVTVTWWYTWLSVVLLLVIFAATLGLRIGLSHAAPIALRATVIALIVLSTATTVRYLLHGRSGLWAARGHRSSTVLLLVPAVLVFAVSLAHPSWRVLGAIPLVVALSALSVERPRSWCAPLLVSIAVVTIGHYWFTTALAEGLGTGIGAEQAEAWRPMLRFGLFYAIFSPFLILLSFWFWDVVLKLDGARVAEAELAVTRERLRFASDLHDIQGHHLQVIALKAELAQRLLERDPEAANIQLRETRAAAREALEETRGLVQGLRQVSLGEELDNAADVLSAAGIACERRAEAEPRNPEVRRVLGLAVREATTNLLRHASPTAASFELNREAAGADGAQRWRLSVVNDGVVDAPSEPGTGLLGLRGRLEPLGGELSTTSRDGCFRLELLVPVPAETTPEGLAEPTDQTGSTASPGRRDPVGKDGPPSPRTEETLA